MIVNIPRNDADDPVFLTALNSMLANLVASYRPVDVHFIRIDRWFDHKWLGYSTKASPRAREYPVWEEKRMLPPFNPNRVLEQISYQRVGNGYQKNPDARLIHKPIRSRSSRNVQNRIPYTELGLFVWFSSDTAHLDYASVMGYAVKGIFMRRWFASFRKSDGAWKVRKVKGIAETMVQSWFPLGS
jgi:hypothetical protein